ncbi:hypothetical protein [Planomonospora parontospora]|uniref:hypothetical protein n=1 Tax=Planomonospora parontospora TaxID=58119 RepID=UPI00167014CF|nr:hypothetical protein [Planomonospora parontospora]GGL58918.1 hypothetical protein GCM10014719_70430 [Planomonospora parontospora subsp. antibiotica]GII20243.1 hypothetical protein Ppa05_69690 [Planomonospora parontospora subsp. antibiotica]
MKALIVTHARAATSGRAVTDPSMARAAAALSERIRAENGAAQAASILETL